MGKKDKEYEATTCAVLEQLYPYREGEQDALRALAVKEKAEVERIAAKPETELTEAEKQMRNRARTKLPSDVQADLPFSLARIARGAFSATELGDFKISITAEELFDCQRKTMAYMIDTPRAPGLLSTGKLDLTSEVMDTIESFHMDTATLAARKNPNPNPKAPNQKQKLPRRMCEVEFIRFADNPYVQFTMEVWRDRFIESTVVKPDPNQPAAGLDAADATDDNTAAVPNTMLDMLERGPLDLPPIPTAEEISAAMKADKRVPTFTFITNRPACGSICLNSGFLMIMPKLYKEDKTVRGFVVMPRLVEAPSGYGITVPLMGRDCDNMGPFHFSFTAARTIPAGSRFVVQLVCCPAESAPTGLSLLSAGEIELFKSTDSDNARVLINPAIQVQFHNVAKDDKTGNMTCFAQSSAVVKFNAPTLILSRSRESHATDGVTSAGYINPEKNVIIAPAVLGQFRKERASLPNSHVAVVLEKTPTRGRFAIKVSSLPDDGKQLLCGARILNGFCSYMPEFHQQHEAMRGIAKYSKQLGVQAAELINSFKLIHKKLTPVESYRTPPTEAEICAGLMRRSDYTGTVVAENVAQALCDDVSLFNANKGPGRSRGLNKKLTELLNSTAFLENFKRYKTRMAALAKRSAERKRPLDDDERVAGICDADPDAQPPPKAARIEVPTGFYREAAAADSQSQSAEVNADVAVAADTTTAAV